MIGFTCKKLGFWGFLKLEKLSRLGRDFKEKDDMGFERIGEKDEEISDFFIENETLV